MRCPTCDGSKEIFGFGTSVDANGVRHCKAGNYPCYLCRGAGEITEPHAARIEAGRKLRAERLARDQSLYDAAKERGISPAELSKLEQGGLP